MSNPGSAHEVTHLLHAHRQGERDASDRLFSLVYDELREMAHRQLLRRRPGRTMNTTALVHEAYLKLFDRAESSWEDRAHFMAVSARAMRHILVDHARRVRAEKRGGGAHRTELTTNIGGKDFRFEILDLDDGLQQLAALNPRLSKVVELRFFGGLSVKETAEVLGVTTRTVDRDWYKAKAFLYLHLRGPEPN